MVSSLQKNPGPTQPFPRGVATFNGFNSFQRPAGPSVTSTLHRWGGTVYLGGSGYLVTGYDDTISLGFHHHENNG